MAEGTNSKQEVSKTGEKDEQKKDYCKTHPTEEIIKYCRDCSKLLCGKCLSDDHKEPDHFIQTLEEVEPWARQMLEKHIVESQVEVERLERHQAYLQHLREENKRRCEQECAQIDRTVAEICAMVRQTGNEALGRFFIKYLNEKMRQQNPNEPDEPELD